MIAQSNEEFISFFYRVPAHFVSAQQRFETEGFPVLACGEISISPAELDKRPFTHAKLLAIESIVADANHSKYFDPDRLERELE